ncbi:MAG: four helix bundle protein [Bacteroidetes bacterium]|nr:MAG: four helix bundle protein [Bacteroidota bacterium]
MHQYKELKTWQKAMDLATELYKVIGTFPSSERFGLSSQMQRSAVSVPSNIAEGAGRSTKADFAKFLDITQGSLNELETQLILAQRLGYIEMIKVDKMQVEINELQKMNYKLILSLRR